MEIHKTQKYSINLSTFLTADACPVQIGVGIFQVNKVYLQNQFLREFVLPG